MTQMQFNINDNNSNKELQNMQTAGYTYHRHKRQVYNNCVPSVYNKKHEQDISKTLDNSSTFTVKRHNLSLFLLLVKTQSEA